MLAKILSVKNAIASALVVSLLTCAPVIAQGAQCQVNGQPGVKISIAINGQTCLPLGTGLQNNAIYFLLIGFVQFAAAGAGFFVVGGIIYGGYLYITARGNSAQSEKARDVILNSVIGLLVFIFMAAILNFLLGRNIFS